MNHPPPSTAGREPERHGDGTTEETSSAYDPSDLHAGVASGLAWSLVISIVVQVTRLISTIILVRLLDPSDYGLAGMAMIVISLVALFQDIGLGGGLIQRRTISETDRSTVFWTTVGIGALSTLVLIALAGPIADFFREPRVKNLVIVASLTLFIGSLSLTQGSLLHRAMLYRATSIRIIIANVGATAVAIAVAVAGGGAWALIAFQLTITSLVTILLWELAAWRPRFTYSRSSLNRFAGFGLNVMGSRLADFTQTNADNILIGRVLGPSALGLYTVAYNVILIPLGRLFSPISGTLFAAGSRLQDDIGRMARLWLRAVHGALGVILPAVLGLIVITPQFVHVVFGAQWDGAIPIIRILAPVAVAYGLSLLADSILLSLDKSHVVFRLTLLNTVLAIGAFVIGLHWGVVGVAASYAIVTIPISVGRVLWVNRLTGISLAAFCRALSGVTQAAVLMTVVCVLARVVISALGAPDWLQLLTVTVVGVVTYSAATYWRNPVLIAEIRMLISRRRLAGTARPRFVSS